MVALAPTCDLGFQFSGTNLARGAEPRCEVSNEVKERTDESENDSDVD